MGELIVQTFVQASSKTVFEVLRDVRRYPKMFKYMKELKVVSSKDNQVLAEILQDMFGFVLWLKAKFIFEPYRRVEIRQTGGPFREAIGWFTLEETDGGTILTHGAKIHASGLYDIIGSIVLATGEAKRRMVREVRAIKEAAEAKANAKKGNRSAK